MTDLSKEWTVYRPNQRQEMGYLATWAVMVRNLIDSRHLIWQLFKRDFFATYKKSFLGVAWVVLTPLFGILVWIFLKHSGVLKPGDVGVPYPAYVLIGTSIWGLFMGFFTSGAQTLTSGTNLVMQIHYPHEVFLFEKCLLQVVHFIVAFMLNILILVFFGVAPSWKMIFLPAVVLPLFLLAAGLGLIVSLFSVVAFDIDKLINTTFGLLVWTIPVIYSEKISNVFLQQVIQWNPLTYLVCSARDLILFGRLYDPAGYLWSSILALSVYLFSWRLFYVSESEIIERIH